MNQKLRVIVPAQCTQLSIVQVLRASAITAQLMPVAWLRFQHRITALGPVQGGWGIEEEEEKEEELVIELQRHLRTWVRSSEKDGVRAEILSIYAICNWPQSLRRKAEATRSSLTRTLSHVSAFNPLTIDSALVGRQNCKLLKYHSSSRPPSVVTVFKMIRKHFIWYFYRYDEVKQGSVF